MSDRPYVRVYSEIIDDPRFAGIFDDDHHLALWLRLLIAADAVWPASAYIPRAARKASLAALCEAGIIELQAGDRYRVHGLDRERTRRSDAARVGGMASVRSRTVARPLNDRSTNAQRQVNLSEPSLAEPRRADAPAPARAREGDIPEGKALAWLAAHGAYITPTGGGLHRRLSSLCERHGPDAVVGALSSLGDGLSDRQYVLGAENALDRIPQPDTRAEADAAEAERKAARERARQERIDRQRAEYGYIAAALEGKEATA